MQIFKKRSLVMDEWIFYAAVHLSNKDKAK